jgi:tRNA (guanine-N7-)-methyltransferase
VSVRRARRLPLEALAPYLLAVPEQPGPLSWSAVFGNEHPVEIEVGFGKGLFLLSSCQQRPAVNFLGIEIVRKYALFTATRFAKRGLANVRLVCGDARRFLADHVPAGSVQAIHVYFPDPWWKKRHLKRRVFTGEFAALCERSLQPDGRLFVSTDVEEYFEVIVKTVAENTRLVRQEEKPAAVPGSEALTNFEKKYREEGRPIFGAVFAPPRVKERRLA